MEEWRDIPTFEGLYQVSSLGRIKRLSMIKKSRSKMGRTFYRTLPERITKGRRDKDGYLTITISNLENRQRAYKIHRLVAMAFIPNPQNLPQINHINGIRDDNRVVNLEWCDARYNQYHAHHLSPLTKSYYNQKSVIVYNSQIKPIRIFSTLSKAAKWLGITKQALRHRIITGKQYNNMTFAYDESSINQ